MENCSEQCLNGGTCLMIKDKAKCFCPWPYFGQNCSKTGIIGNSIGLRGDGYLEFQTPMPKFMTILFSTEEDNYMFLVQGTDKTFWMISSKYYDDSCGVSSCAL